MTRTVFSKLKQRVKIKKYLNINTKPWLNSLNTPISEATVSDDQSHYGDIFVFQIKSYVFVVDQIWDINSLLIMFLLIIYKTDNI